MIVVLLALLALLAPFYAARLLRTTSFGELRVDRSIKPWACDVCLSFWLSALEVLYIAGALAVAGELERWHLFAAPIALFGISAATLVLLEFSHALTPPQPLPPEGA